MSDTALASRSQDKIEERANRFLAKCRELVVDSPAALTRADELVTLGANEKKIITGFFGPLKKSASDHHKTLVAAERAALTPIESGCGIAFEKLRAFKREEQRKRDEELRAHEEKRRKDEEEREKKRQEEAEKLKAECPDMPPEVVEKAVADVVQAKLPETPAPLAAVQNLPKTNTGSRTVYDVEIEDDTKIPREYLMFDASKARRVVAAAKGKISIPGIRIVAKEVAVKRTG